MRGDAAAALFVGAEEFAAEGVATVLESAAALGVDAVAVALAYHAARDVTPHAPHRVTWRRDGIHFAPADGAFGTLVPPRASDDAALVPAVIAGARQYGLEALGWAVFLHNEALGSRHPDITHVNCFGGRATLGELCPAHPAVRAYCVELAVAVAATGARAVLAESLHFAPFGHGYHHERSFVELGELAEFALALCFCAHCVARASVAGVDVDEARASARRLVDAGADEPYPLTPQALRERGGEALAAVAAARVATVTSLVAEVAAALAAEGTRLCFLDITGAYQGYADGLPGPASGLDDAWRYGIDPAELSRHADYGILAYARDPRRVADETTRYRAALAPSSALRVLLRPGAPDCDSVANLAAKVGGARGAGAASIDFYHYGLTPLPVLDRIPRALEAAAS